MLIDYTWIEREGRTPACFRKDIRGTSALTTFKYFYKHLTSLRIFVVKKHLPVWIVTGKHAGVLPSLSIHV